MPAPPGGPWRASQLMVERSSWRSWSTDHTTWPRVLLRYGATLSFTPVEGGGGGASHVWGGQACRSRLWKEGGGHHMPWGAAAVRGHAVIHACGGHKQYAMERVCVLGGIICHGVIGV